MGGVLLSAAMLAAGARGARGASGADPIPDASAVVAFGDARFTMLSESLIRLQNIKSTRGGKLLPDDRATAVVVNRRFPGGVPRFTVAHPNASAVTITTAKLRLTYSSPQQPELDDSSNAAATCGCRGTECISAAAQNITWQVHPHMQGGDGHRTSGCPDGLTNQTLDSCFCACMSDPDCEAITFAPAGQDLGKSCWLLAGGTKTTAVGDRTFVGMEQGGFKGFTDANLQIEFLDASAPIKSWHPSDVSTANLNGSFTNFE